MSRIDTYSPGQFSWVDLMSKDADAAASFYQSLFGWSREDQFDHAGNRVYTLYKRNGVDVAGMGEMGEEMKNSGIPSTWASYINVTDVDAAVARCQELGATVLLPPMDVMNAGRMSVVTDPQGAAFSLWEQRDHLGAGLVNEPGAFCWNELLTRDVAASQRFYSEAFGWEIKRSADGGDEYYEILNAGRLNGGFLPWRPEMGDAPPHWAVYFSVADCDASVRRAEELGGKKLMGPVDIAPGRFAVMSDPFGAMFNLMYVRDPD